MSRKALLVLAFTAMLGSRASFAGVFADVPFDHWAYQAVEELAQAGVLEGYPDGSMRGPQAMTRYEFAVAVSRLYQWILKAIPEGLTKEDLEKALKDPAVIERFRGPAGAAGKDGAQGGQGEAGKDGKDGKDGQPGEQGPEGKPGRDGKDAPMEWLARLDTLEKLVKEFKGELDSMGAQVEAMLARLTALESKVAALTDRVDDHDARLTKLEKFQWFASVKAAVGLDGSQDILGGAVRDGSLDFEPGEAFSYLSLRAGIDGNLGGDMRGRFSWWYDSDGNQHHGKIGGGPRGNAGLAAIGIDEAWVRLPGLGGRWIFGRQYAGQDYQTGDSNPSLGMGTGYYTGAALTGIRGQYDIGKHVVLTGMVQADDNFSNFAGLGGNVAAVGRLDATIPWWKTSKGEPLVKVGFQSVGHVPNTAAAVPLGAVKRYNDGTRSGEWSITGDLWLNVLKGFRIEYTNQLKAANGANPIADPYAGPVRDTSNNAQSVYAELGVLKTPTFTLNVAGGLIEEDFQLSHSIFSNPYVPIASGAFALFDAPTVLTPPALGAFGLASQGFDVHFTWNIGKRPLKIRWSGSTFNRDPFNYMIYGELPLVMTDRGNVSIGGGYINVAPTHVLGASTTAVRVTGGFSF